MASVPPIRPRHILRRLMAAALEFSLPSFCVLCGPAVASDCHAHLCADCVAGLPLLPARAQCRRCAGLMNRLDTVRGICAACYRRRVPWRRLVAVGPFEGTLADLVRTLKYDRNCAAAEPLGRLLAAQAVAADLGTAAEMQVVPLPLSSARYRQRGFNQAELLGRYAARALGIPLRPGWLSRQGPERRQVGRAAAGRMQLSRASFTASHAVYGRHIILVDDVVTTGATARAATRTLIRAGAAEVSVLACGRTRLRGM